MANDPGGRRFSDREVERIFRAAAELQASAPPDVRAHGLSLADLEQIGGEVGMDRALIHEAVRAVDAGAPRRRGPRLLGAPTELVVERTIPGAAGTVAHQALLAALRDATGDLGEIGTVGALFGWRGRLDKAKLDVQLSAAEGRSVLRLRAALGEVVGDSFVAPAVLGGGGAGFVVVAITGGAIGGPPLLLAGALAGAGVLGARWYYGRRVAGYRDRLEAFADVLAARVAEQVGEPEPAAALPPAR